MYLVYCSTAEEPDLLRTRIGDALRRERRAQGRTLQDLADKAHISRSHLSDIERGAKEAASETLRGIYRELGMELDDLLHQMTNPPTSELSTAA